MLLLLGRRATTAEIFWARKILRSFSLLLILSNNCISKKVFADGLERDSAIGGGLNQPDVVRAVKDTQFAQGTTVTMHSFSWTVMANWEIKRRKLPKSVVKTLTLSKQG